MLESQKLAGMTSLRVGAILVRSKIALRAGANQEKKRHIHIINIFLDSEEIFYSVFNTNPLIINLNLIQKIE